MKKKGGGGILSLTCPVLSVRYLRYRQEVLTEPAAAVEACAMLWVASWLLLVGMHCKADQSQTRDQENDLLESVCDLTDRSFFFRLACVRGPLLENRRAICNWPARSGPCFLEHSLCLLALQLLLSSDSQVDYLKLPKQAVDSCSKLTLLSSVVVTSVWCQDK